MIFTCWKILCQLAPWLLLGMLLSGLLHVMLPAGFVRRKFHGVSGVIKAVLLGVPLPLCSCGVVPAGIGLKNQGASDGASVGFLISTPQTGIDSILVSASFFGWPFAIFKMVTAAITGFVGGVLADRAKSADDLASQVGEDELNQHEHHAGHHGHGHGHSHGDDSEHPAWIRATLHAVEIVRSIWGWLVIGIVVSAAIEHWMPEAWIEGVGGWGLLPSMLLVLLISVPLYVCATASVPIAAALVTAGMPPAAALVFLMAGPATNVTTIGAIKTRFGWRTLLVYLATIIIGSMLFAWMFDWLLTSEVATGAAHVHDHTTWWSIASAMIMLGLIGWFIVGDSKRWLRRRAAGVASVDQPVTEVVVEGMNCSSCVNKLESELLKTEGIATARVELKPGKATVTGTAPLSEITAVIHRAGFNVPAK